MSESNNNNMCVVKISGIFVHFFESHFVPGVEINVMEDHHKFLDHIINFCGRFDLRGDENFNRDGIIQNGVELIKLLFVILVRNLLISNLLVFDGLGHLSLLSG